MPSFRDRILFVLNEIQRMLSLFIWLCASFIHFCDICIQSKLYALHIINNSIWYEFDWANWWIRKRKFTNAYKGSGSIKSAFHFSSLFFYFNLLLQMASKFISLFRHIIQCQCNQQLPLWTNHSHFHINSENIQSLTTSSFQNLMNNCGKRFAFCLATSIYKLKTKKKLEQFSFQNDMHLVFLNRIFSHNCHCHLLL